MAGEGDSPPITIRAARVADAEAMLAIYGPVVEQTAISFEVTVPSVGEFGRRIETVSRSDLWLAATTADDERLVGYAYASPFRSRPAYGGTRETTVYVDPAHHGTGVGRRLLQRLLRELAARGHHMAVAGVVLPNDGSIGLHRALGFVHVGTFTEVGHKFGRWHDLSFWQRRLGDRPG
ncbi:MAG: N-acetyltransferase family protein [Actinomycetota bacterium]